MKSRLILMAIFMGMMLLWGCVSIPPGELNETQAVGAGQAEVLAVEGSPTKPVDMDEQTVTSTIIVSGNIEPSETPQKTVEPETKSTQQIDGGDAVVGNSNMILADVISVQASGSEGAYQFSVGIRSPDTGCDQYADWWEVVSEDGELIYRRILLHSHVTEQPFVRSGGPASISPETVVWVRAHMNLGGYGGVVFKGSVQRGFIKADLNEDFAADLAETAPLPDGCAF